MDAGQGCEVTRLCLRLAERFRAADVSHPVAAAASVTARGLTGLDPTAFSRRHSLEPSDIAAGEAGEVAFGDLPGAVGTILEGSGKVCLLQLADLTWGTGPTGKASVTAWMPSVGPPTPGPSTRLSCRPRCRPPT